MIHDTDPIDLTDDRQESVDSRKTDVPVISIERTADTARDPATAVVVSGGGRPRRRGLRLKVAVALSVIAAAVIAIWYNNGGTVRLDLPVSVSDDENIALLSTGLEDAPAVTEIVSDSVLGVAFDMYSLQGLAASLEYRMPDPDDSTLRLFCRSADYRNTYHDRTSRQPIIMGSTVVDGERVSRDRRETRHRPAYMAIAPDGNAVIGVSVSDKVMDHVEQTGGSFFRQAVLLSAGTLPGNFNLHGKVERAAIGRMADGSLYYIVTRHRESMYDFADALREYGFVDAIYITGGNAYDYHRSADGRPVVSDALREKYDKYGGSSHLRAPLLVFRAR